ncbi:MAG: peptidoglycan-binding domain-containing protein [Candidatus Rokuibacteriota bacterium]
MASQQQVKSVQEALKEKGYDPGAIDGAMGPRTSAALRDFQKAEGLQATGRVDAETRGKLGI